jgi:hypothetical protein
VCRRWVVEQPVSYGQCGPGIHRWRRRQDCSDRAHALSSGRSHCGTSAPTSASGSSRPRAGSDLPLSLLLSARGVRGSSYRVYVHHGDESRTSRSMKTPFLARQMLKWFHYTFTSTAWRRPLWFFVGEGFGRSSSSYGGTRWTRGFVWFGPPERNTLRPQEWIVQAGS